MTLILSGTDGVSDIDGTAATPAIRGTDANTGIFFPAADTIAFAEGGTESMRIDSSGILLVGTTTSTNNIRLNQKLAAVAAGSNQYSGISATSYGGTTGHTVVDLQTSRGTTDGSMTKVENGDRVGALVFRGSDGSTFRDVALIASEMDGATGANDMPGRLVFSTTADGASSTTQRMLIDSSGDVAIGTTTGSIFSTSGINLSVSNASGLATVAIAGSSGNSGYLELGQGSVRGALIEGSTNSMIFYTNGTGTGTSVSERMRIDSSGRVTVPYQPGFKVGRVTSSQSVASGGTYIFNDTGGTGGFNTGSHYSTTTGIFTAPVAGRYIFTVIVIIQSATEGGDYSDLVTIQVNNNIAQYSLRRAEYIAGTTGNGGYYTDSLTTILNLAANDAVKCVNNNGGGFTVTLHANVNYSTFCGYLLG